MNWNKTLWIGLDGATFSVLDPLMESGAMPFLREFARQGVRATLLSTPNPLTPPAWTSLMTGRSPGYHGIFDFIWAEERKTDHYFTLHNFRDIRCETLWSIVSRQGGRACSLNYPLMSPPPVLSGCVVPGLVSWKHLGRNVHPRELYDEMKAIEGFSVRELAWDFDMEKKAERGVPEEEYENWIEFHIRRERQWFRVAQRLMQQHPCDLTGMLFDGPDKLLHMGWRFLDPRSFPASPSPWEAKMRDLCRRYFSELDTFIAELVRQAGPEARIFFTSDHGFGPTHFVFRVNTWLNEQGYLTWKDLNTLDAGEKEKAQRVVDRHFVMLDWERTTAYARTTTSNGIFIRVAREPGQTGVPAAQYEAFRAELTRKLLAIRHPLTGEAVVRRVLTREQAFPGPYNQQAPDLTLEMSDYSFISILNKTPAVFQRPCVEGTHHPHGIFLAGGPGIRRGQIAPDLSIVDFAPAVLHSLGLKIPSDFEGRVPEAVFTPEFMQQRPVSPGAATLAPEQAESATPVVADQAEQDEIYKRLQALGYME